ncbi:MAG: multicopper oxidase domain-containing protein, partial [Rhodothermales bacterium]|nr:multicopper oxidase domain-containing protein [Rhodothermales bacterium]
MRALFLAAVLALPGLAAAQPAPCDAHRAEAVSTDLYCLDLVATAAAEGASGTVALGRTASPFGVAVTADGHLRYDLLLEIEGLPDPATLGPYTAYVAWATTPVLDPVVKLGPVGNGRFAPGEVAFNKFLILVTAEASAAVTQRTGRLVLRGRSPSTRMEAHDLMTTAPAALLPPDDATDGHAHHGAGGSGWAMPPMRAGMPMLPGMQGRVPPVAPFLPAPAGPIPEAQPRRRVALADGDTLRLTAGPVRRRLRGRDAVLYGFNGQLPGPLLDVSEQATVTVEFTNETPWPTAVHWHGIRLDNRFDGVPGVTQAAVPPGGVFTYRVFFRDPGLYWYHPHHREDVFQDLGLYGNLLVRPAAPGYYGPAHREVVWMLDDLLLDDAGPVPYGEEAATHAMMGRFGNVFLVNGAPAPEETLSVRRGEVVRFFLTNVANTRTFNVSLGSLPLKVVASDVGKFEREEWAESVVLAPAERYVVEARFPEPGTVALVNRVQAVDHRAAAFFAEVDTLALVHVEDTPVDDDLADAFARLRTNADVAADLAAYRAAFARP